MRPRALIAAVVLALFAGACSVTSSVATERADRIGAGLPADQSADQTDPSAPPASSAPVEEPATPDDEPTSAPTTDVVEPDATAPATTEAPSEPPTTGPPTASVPQLETDPTLIDFGQGTPPLAWDDFLLAVMTDLEAWWSVEYPAIYGEPHRSLDGGVFAAHPQRIDPIPGCGEPETSYDDVQQFVAFYCGAGDFVVYDSGPDSLLTELAGEFGPSTIGIVLAHEYGHAIQLRSGALNRALATIRTEQQADCFAGAWSGRAFRGEATTLVFSDADVRAGLVAMTRVADPVGLNQLSNGGHGSAFDRVGAFQVGFLEGPARCAEILDAPLPLVPNEFRSFDDLETGGNAPLGFEDGELLAFLPADLNLYWDVQLDSQIFGFDSLTLEAASVEDEIDCLAPSGDFGRGAVLCRQTSTVWLNLPLAEQRFNQLGDFAVGYVLGVAWAEAVQQALGSELTGESRELANDCLAGAWVQTVIPVDGGGLPQPRPEERVASVSPGDLDEAIQTVLLIGDLGAEENVVGSAFEKIDAFRTGVLDGLDSCLARL